MAPLCSSEGFPKKLQVRPESRLWVKRWDGVGGKNLDSGLTCSFFGNPLMKQRGAIYGGRAKSKKL